MDYLIVRMEQHTITEHLLKHVIQMIQIIHDGEMDDVVHHVNQLHSRIHSVIVHITDIHNIQALQRHG